MTTTININGKETEIELTPEQIKKIKALDMKITDRIKTFEDALEACPPSDKVKTLLNYNGADKQMISTQAHAKISIIAKALNQGWVPDFDNSNETKYYPWFEYSPGVGFSFSDCDGGGDGSFVGSRLCFKTRELAEYAGKQFQSIYNDFLN